MHARDHGNSNQLSAIRHSRRNAWRVMRHSMAVTKLETCCERSERSQTVGARDPSASGRAEAEKFTGRQFGFPSPDPGGSRESARDRVHARRGTPASVGTDPARLPHGSTSRRAAPFTLVALSAMRSHEGPVAGSTPTVIVRTRDSVSADGCRRTVAALRGTQEN